MDFNDAKFFYYVGKYLSFTKAAEELYVAQSSVSERIKRFEESLGFPLFVREKNKIHFTIKGETLHAIVARFVIEMNDFEESMTISRNSITIGLPPHLGSGALKNIFPIISCKFNEIYLEYGTFEENYSHLLLEKIDCIISANSRKDPNTKSIHIGTTQNCLIASSDFDPLQEYDFYYVRFSSLDFNQCQNIQETLGGKGHLIDISSNMIYHLNYLGKKNCVAIVPKTFADELLTTHNAQLLNVVNEVNLYCIVKNTLLDEKMSILSSLSNINI